MFGIVYLVTNTRNGKVYVGQTTKNLQKRWYDHCKTAIRGKARGSPKLHNAIRKDGASSFTIAKVTSADNREDLNALETLAIQCYNALNHGYNIGLGGYTMPDYVHKKRAATLRAMGHRPPVPTTEQRAELGKANSVRMKGKEPTWATAARSRPCVIDGNEYPSVENAALVIGLSVTTVRARLRDGRLVSYHFKGEIKVHSGEDPSRMVAIYKGVTYPNFLAVCNSVGLSPQMVRNRLKAKGITLAGVRHFNFDELVFDPFNTTKAPGRRKTCSPPDPSSLATG